MHIFTEQDEEFYGSDLETPMVVAEHSDAEDNGSEDDLDLGILIARVGSNEDDQANA